MRLGCNIAHIFLRLYIKTPSSLPHNRIEQRIQASQHCSEVGLLYYFGLVPDCHPVTCAHLLGVLKQPSRSSNDATHYPG